MSSGSLGLLLVAGPSTDSQCQVLHDVRSILPSGTMKPLYSSLVVFPVAGPSTASELQLLHDIFWVLAPGNTEPSGSSLPLRALAKLGLTSTSSSTSSVTSPESWIQGV
ncbi:uncharacterized protein LOC135370446 [Ornithodoros turicata]|uniref:uncharacterized protein LOC135370446 n=1 Tax=Ornithodoros turicata TaxID=34597 RepID=UPI003138DA94